MVGPFPFFPGAGAGFSRSLLFSGGQTKRFPVSNAFFIGTSSRRSSFDTLSRQMPNHFGWLFCKGAEGVNEELVDFHCLSSLVHSLAISVNSFVTLSLIPSGDPNSVCDIKLDGRDLAYGITPCLINRQQKLMSCACACSLLAPEFPVPVPRPSLQLVL